MFFVRGKTVKTPSRWDTTAKLLPVVFFAAEALEECQHSDPEEYEDARIESGCAEVQVFPCHCCDKNSNNNCV